MKLRLLKMWPMITLQPWLLLYSRIHIFTKFNHLIRVSRQAFPRKIGQKVRRVPETHGYCNVAIHILHTWNLGFKPRIHTWHALYDSDKRESVAGTQSQLCIANYKYRYTTGKKDVFNWLAQQACTHTYLTNFHLKKYSPKRASGRR